MPEILFRLEPWFYRIAPLLVMNFIDEPAMLALVFS
jgi:hypothetical protein